MPKTTKTPKVWVLWDPATDRPRGKTHALDCSTAQGLSNYVESSDKPGYRAVDASMIPPETGRCGYCGGGR